MEEGRAQYQEDPRRWNNFTLGLHAEILVRMVPKYRMFEKELKMASDKNKHKIWALLLYLMALTSFQQNYHNNRLLVTPNEMVGLYCRDQPLNNPPLFSLFFTWYQDLPSKGSLHGARIFLVLGSVLPVSQEDPSTGKIPALGKSTTLCM